MRISDWSSDVCSSDLGRRVAAPRIGDRRDRLVDRARYVERDDPRPMLGAGEPFGALRVGDDQRRLDRKSVVAGKSVSVRVDLGGRRIIKKQKSSNTKDINSYTT